MDSCRLEVIRSGCKDLSAGQMDALLDCVDTFVDEVERADRAWMNRLGDDNQGEDSLRENRLSNLLEEIKQLLRGGPPTNRQQSGNKNYQTAFPTTV